MYNAERIFVTVDKNVLLHSTVEPGLLKNSVQYTKFVTYNKLHLELCRQNLLSTWGFLHIRMNILLIIIWVTKVFITSSSVLNSRKVPRYISWTQNSLMLLLVHPEPQFWMCFGKYWRTNKIIKEFKWWENINPLCEIMH